MPESQQLDSKRIQQAARGDPEAFAELFNHFFQPVYNYALSLCGDPAQAEDLTQEGFIRAHANLGSFGPPWNFRTWIFRLVRNIFIDLTRKAKPEDPIEEAGMISSAHPTPEKEVMLKEMAVRVRRTLGGLSPQNREVLELREMQGFSYGEMAEVMGISTSQVGVMLHRARNSFQQAYGVKLLVEAPTEDCPEVQRLLNAYHDGETLGDREQFVKDHLKTCDACQERQRWLVTQSGVFSALVPVIPPPGLAGRILQKTGIAQKLDETRLKRRNRRQVTRRAMKVGGAIGGGVAVVAIVLGGLYALFSGGGPPAPPAASTALPASATAEPQQQAAGTDVPGVAQPPPVSATPTSGEPSVTVSVDTNCREGPGDAYASAGALLEGETAILIAWDGRGEYALIQNPDGPGVCWLWLFFAEVFGDPGSLPVATPPPSPTASPSPASGWAGAWSMWFDGVVYTGVLSVSGNMVSGVMDAGTPNDLNVSGTISSDGQMVSGTYFVSGGGTGSFVWGLSPSENQFTGNAQGGTFAWCGWRAEAVMPSVCLGP